MKKSPPPLTAASDQSEAVPLAQFLEGYPPGQTVEVVDLFIKKQHTTGGHSWHLNTPQLSMHCTEPSCNGPRFFRYMDGDVSVGYQDTEVQRFITYVCSNFRHTRKFFSLRATRRTNNEVDGQCYKFGELPVYGPPTPARLIRLFGDERETFLKGRQCENHGLGIGAFVYYRRVVENQKNHILDEIIRVSEKIGAPSTTINALQIAKNETQFSKAIVSIRDAIPQSLLINGHNPLTLLHRALSAGLHDRTDEDCLKLAHDVRVVLIELAERLGQALKDEAELTNAINRLSNPKTTS